MLQRLINRAMEKGWRREYPFYKVLSILYYWRSDSETLSITVFFLDLLAITLSQYLDKRDLLTNPEEQSRLLREVPEVVAEEVEPECVDDGKIENDFVEPNPEVSLEAPRQSDKEQQLSDSPVSSIQKTLENSKLRNGDDQPTWTASAGACVPSFVTSVH